MLTVEALRAYFQYDPSTGLFSRNGKVLGSVYTNGYVYVYFQKRYHRAHILAWIYTYGERPDGALDHKDGDRTNNAISNLRILSAFHNSHNRRGSNLGREQALGVNAYDYGGAALRYTARLNVRGRRLYLGSYATQSAATAAYDLAKYMFVECAA